MGMGSCSCSQVSCQSAMLMVMSFCHLKDCYIADIAMDWVHLKGTKPKTDTCLRGAKEFLRLRASENFLQIIQKCEIWFLEFWRTRTGIIIISVAVKLPHRIQRLHSFALRLPKCMPSRSASMFERSDRLIFFRLCISCIRRPRVVSFLVVSETECVPILITRLLGFWLDEALEDLFVHILCVHWRFTSRTPVFSSKSLGTSSLSPFQILFPNSPEIVVLHLD